MFSQYPALNTCLGINELRRHRGGQAFPFRLLGKPNTRGLLLRGAMPCTAGTSPLAVPRCQPGLQEPDRLWVRHLSPSLCAHGLVPLLRAAPWLSCPHHGLRVTLDMSPPAAGRALLLHHLTALHGSVPTFPTPFPGTHHRNGFCWNVWIQTGCVRGRNPPRAPGEQTSSPLIPCPQLCLPQSPAASLVC